MSMEHSTSEPNLLPCSVEHVSVGIHNYHININIIMRATFPTRPYRLHQITVVIPIRTHTACPGVTLQTTILSGSPVILRFVKVCYNEVIHTTIGCMLSFSSSADFQVCVLKRDQYQGYANKEISF